MHGKGEYFEQVHPYLMNKALACFKSHNKIL